MFFFFSRILTVWRPYENVVAKCPRVCLVGFHALMLTATQDTCGLNWERLWYFWVGKHSLILDDIPTQNSATFFSYFFFLHFSHRTDPGEGRGAVLQPPGVWTHRGLNQRTYGGQVRDLAF